MSMIFVNYLITNKWNWYEWKCCEWKWKYNKPWLVSKRYNYV